VLQNFLQRFCNLYGVWIKRPDGRHSEFEKTDVLCKTADPLGSAVKKSTNKSETTDFLTYFTINVRTIIQTSDHILQGLAKKCFFSARTIRQFCRAHVHDRQTHHAAGTSLAIVDISCTRRGLKIFYTPGWSKMWPQRWLRLQKYSRYCSRSQGNEKHPHRRQMVQLNANELTWGHSACLM